MRWPWSKEVHGNGVREARAERELSERKLHDSRDILEELREIRKHNHIADMITKVIQQQHERGVRE